jgi:Na+/melibiose symporter-like transporter
MTMSRRQQIAFLGCSFSIGVFSSFNNFTLSLWLTGLTGSLLLIGLLANTRGLLGSIVSPVAGAWSDHTWLGWLGRRRPFILVGGLTAAALMALTPVISRLPLPPALGWLPPDVLRLTPAIAILMLITICFNLMDDIHKALLPDLTTPGRPRNRLSSLMVVTDMGGQVLILVIGYLVSAGGIPDLLFLLTGALVAAGVLLTVLGVREPDPAAWLAERAGDGSERLTPLLLVRRYRAAAILGLVVFSYWFGVNAVMPLVSIYTRTILGASDAEAQLLPALLLLSTTVMAVPMGWLGTRYGKRRMIGTGHIIMGLCALAGLIITTKGEGAALFLFAGVGNAAIMVLTLPLLADLVPRDHMGAATGLLAAAGGVAAPLSSLVAGSLSDLYGPRAIFAVMAVMVLIAFLLLIAVRQPAPAPTTTTYQARPVQS